LKEKQKKISWKRALFHKRNPFWIQVIIREKCLYLDPVNNLYFLLKGKSSLGVIKCTKEKIYPKVRMVIEKENKKT